MKRHSYILVVLFSLFLTLACTGCHGGDSASELLAAANAELERDSIERGETLLRRAIVKAENEADWHTQYIALQRLAESLSWSNTAEALRMAKQAVSIYEAHPDDERNHIILLDCAGTYASQLAYNTDGSYDEALALTQRAYELAEQEQMAEQRCETLTSLANIFWAMEDYEKALGYARRAMQQVTPDLRQGTMQVLARCYLDCDSLQQAETLYRQMETDDDIHTAYIVQSNLAKIAVRRQSPELAEAAIDSAFEQVEDLYFHALGQKDDYYQAVLYQEQKNARMRTWMVAACGFGVLLLAAVILLRYRLRLTHQRHRFETERHEHLLRLQEKEKQLLQQQSETQQAQLHQASEVIAILQKLILKRSEVVKKLLEQDHHLRVVLAPHEWTDVERTLNAIDDDCIARLRQQFPNMEEEDVQLCILARLGLTNRAIGNIFHITLSAVQHRKLRLKKAIFGEDNPDITFDEVLNRHLSTNTSNILTTSFDNKNFP